MAVSLSTVHILVDDLDAALAFYRDTLGLTMRNAATHDGFRSATLVTESQSEIGIGLSHPHAGRSQDDGDALDVLLAKGELLGPFFSTDDLRATFDKIVTLPGVEVLQEPLSKPCGSRDIALLDPARNLVRIQQKE